MSAGSVVSKPLNDEGSEREPLLSKTPGNNDQLEAGDDRDVGPGETLVESPLAGPKPEPTKWTVWNVAFYSLLAAFGVFLLVVVVKGFVDVKDPTDIDV
jgi:hypothetical protein